MALPLETLAAPSSSASSRPHPVVHSAASLGPTPDAAITGPRFGAALLAYLVGVAVVITLVPFDFVPPAGLRIDLTMSPSDVIANILLFFPLGFLARLSLRGRGGRFAWRILFAGILMSAAIECLQEFEAARFPSPIDVVTNAAGAWLGALAHDRISRRLSIDAAVLGRLSLEIPLMGIVYLLIPLLWLDGLAMGADPDRVLLTPLLGLFGVVVLGAIHRHQWHVSGALSHSWFAVLVAGWFLTGAFPALLQRPEFMMTAAVGVAVASFFLAVSAHGIAPDRRYEAWAIRRGLPLFAVYLFVLTVPLHPLHQSWTLGWSLGIGNDAGTVAILRFLELLGGFTLLGYIVAELRGRREERFRMTARAIALWMVPTVTVAEAIRGFEIGGASAGRGISLVAGALYGALVYHLQRAHVRALVAERRIGGQSSDVRGRNRP